MCGPYVMSSRVCVACLIVRILPAHLLPGCLAANLSGDKGLGQLTQGSPVSDHGCEIDDLQPHRAELRYAGFEAGDLDKLIR